MTTSYYMSGSFTQVYDMYMYNNYMATLIEEGHTNTCIHNAY